MNLFHRNCHNYFRSNYSLDRYVVHYGLANDIINIYCNSDIYGNNDSIRSQNAKISMNTQTEIANFSGLLGRVLTEMRLVKVSNTERQELNNAHSNLREFIIWVCDKQNYSHSTHFKCDYVINDCGYIRFGFR